jgi:hypothetical protein
MTDVGHLTGNQRVPYSSDISSLAGPSWGTYDSRATLDFLVDIASRPNIPIPGRGAGESVRRRSARVHNTSASACKQAPSNVGLKGRKLAQTLSRSNSLFSLKSGFRKREKLGAIARNSAALERDKSGCTEVFRELSESSLVRYPSQITVRASRFVRTPIQGI